jgi:hypothetical protein
MLCCCWWHLQTTCLTCSCAYERWSLRQLPALQLMLLPVRLLGLLLLLVLPPPVLHSHTHRCQTGRGVCCYWMGWQPRLPSPSPVYYAGQT